MSSNHTHIPLVNVQTNLYIDTYSHTGTHTIYHLISADRKGHSDDDEERQLDTCTCSVHWHNMQTETVHPIIAEEVQTESEEHEGKF